MYPLLAGVVFQVTCVLLVFLIYLIILVSPIGFLILLVLLTVSYPVNFVNSVKSGNSVDAARFSGSRVTLRCIDLGMITNEAH